MAANTGERTLISSLVPPGVAHINGVFAFGSPNVPSPALVATAGTASSLLVDFAVRAVPKSGIYQGVFERLPRLAAPRVRSALVLRTLRLSCLVNAYAALWEECFEGAFGDDRWTSDTARTRLGEVGPAWSPEVPLRVAVDRRQALVEIDALVAVAMSITGEELCTIYRTQFPVMAGYDRNTHVFDAGGRMVPTRLQQVWRRRGGSLTGDERTVRHPGSGIKYTYELPFRVLDREADLRRAHAEFERRFSNSV